MIPEEGTAPAGNKATEDDKEPELWDGLWWLMTLITYKANIILDFFQYHWCSLNTC